MMVRHAGFLLGALAIAAAPLAAGAASLAGDEVMAGYDDNAPDTLTVDIGATLFGTEYELVFTDDDSFTFFPTIFGQGDLLDLSFAIGDLNFAEAGSPVDVTGFAFDAAGTSAAQQEFFNGGEFSDVTTSFGPDSVSFGIGFVSAALAGDAPPFLFDITAEGDTAVIPLPAGAWLLLTAMAGLFAAGRRRLG